MTKRVVEFEEAIVTSLIRYGDADCIARLYCRGRGRVSAFAKNGLKPSKTRGGILQAPAKVTVGLIGSPQAQLLRIASLDVLSATFLWSSSLKSFGWAAYLSEIVEIFIAEQDGAEFFETFALAMQLVAQGCHKASLLRAFELKLLAYCGYLPDLTTAVDPSAMALATAHLGDLPEVDTAVLHPIGRIFSAQLKQIAREPLRSVAFLKSIGV